MKFEIKTLDDEALDEYKNVLDKYNAEYFHDEEENDYYGHYAVIEISKLEDLLELRKQLDHELIFVGNEDHLVSRGTKYTDLECVLIKNGVVY